MQVIAENRKARFNYFILDTYQAGIVLTGSEIKSVRAHKVSFADSYISIRNGKALIKGLSIAQYEQATYNNHEEKRDRQLLLHKSQIAKLSNAIKLNGQTIIPLSMVIDHGLAKVNIALAKGKNLYDKRETSKKRDLERAASAAMKFKG